MSLWILDTDRVSLFLAENKPVVARVAKHLPNVAITVITIQELFNGWNGKLNDPKQINKLSHLYTKLWKTTEFFKVITIINFNQNAESCYLNLQQSDRALSKKIYVLLLLR